MKRIIGDSYWWHEKMDALQDDVMDAAMMSASEARQMFYNTITSSESAFFTRDEVMGALMPGCTGTERDLQHGDEITLGFDGSKTSDATALVAIRIRDRLIVPLHVQHKPYENVAWHVDEAAVDEAVMAAFKNYKVKAFFADVHLWESYISKWVEEYGEVLEVGSTNSKIGFDMRGNKEKVARAFEAFRQAIKDRALFHNGDGFFKIHALNAHTSHNGHGITAKKAKPDSPDKIDVMISAYIAYTALRAWIERGKKKKDYSRKMLRSSQNAGY
jgi:phage terminase large subunit-like protein